MAEQNMNPAQINPPPMLQIPPRPPVHGIQQRPPSPIGTDLPAIDATCFKVVIMQCTAALHCGAASVTLNRQHGLWSFLPDYFVSSAVSASSSCPIQHLILKQHRLDCLPDNFSSPDTMLPSSLNTLDLSYNCFVSVPSVICDLVNLHELFLHNNKISSAPENLSTLIHLQVLHLQNNHLKELPTGICGLVSVQHINVDHNQLVTIPSEISKMSSLQVLHASSNKIEYLPDSITELTNLQELYLSQNQLKVLPDRLNGLSSLCQLHLANNRLSFLPLSFVNLKSLKSFTVSGNSLKFPPLSACRNGVESLKKFMTSKYQSEQWSSKDVCNNLYFESDSGEDTPFEDIDDD